MPYDIPHLKEAIFEAERFLIRAKESLKDLESQTLGTWPDGVLAGATRRASMDLTRALAKLRKY